MNKYNESPEPASLPADKAKIMLHQDSENSPEKTPGRCEPSNTYKSQGLIDSSDDEDAEYEEIKDEDLMDPDNVIEPDPRIQALLK